MRRDREIRIERLAVRLRGVPAPLARTAVDGLGRHLIERLAESSIPLEPGGRVELPLLDAGTIHVARPAAAAGVSEAIVDAVACSIEQGQAGKRRT
jgi:hypothetical protein